jgi:hypothetical protein
MSPTIREIKLYNAVAITTFSSSGCCGGPRYWTKLTFNKKSKL